MCNCRECNRCRQPSCHCSPRRIGCCKERKKTELLKECICVEWLIPSGETQTVFKTIGYDYILASGFVTLDNGSCDYVVVRFYKENIQTGPPIQIFRDSSLAFTYTQFDQITIEANKNENNLSESCEGEICINTHVPIQS